MSSGIAQIFAVNKHRQIFMWNPHTRVIHIATLLVAEFLSHEKAGKNKSINIFIIFHGKFEPENETFCQLNKVVSLPFDKYSKYRRVKVELCMTTSTMEISGGNSNLIWNDVEKSRCVYEKRKLNVKLHKKWGGWKNPSLKKDKCRSRKWRTNCCWIFNEPNICEATHSTTFQTNTFSPPDSRSLTFFTQRAFTLLRYGLLLMFIFNVIKVIEG